MRQKKRYTGDEIDFPDIASHVRKNDFCSAWIDLKVHDLIPKIQASDGRTDEAVLIFSSNYPRVFFERRSDKKKKIETKKFEATFLWYFLQKLMEDIFIYFILGSFFFFGRDGLGGRDKLGGLVFFWFFFFWFFFLVFFFFFFF